MNSDLFEQPKIGCFPTPRPFQETTHQSLREGFRNEHRAQIVSAPTGSGKTVVGLRIAKEATERGKRATFLCDRTALIDQTSTRADEYGLTDHAIIQANHPRRDKGKLLQIASVQTIRRRVADFGGSWPDTDVLIVDECHTVYPEVAKYIAETKAAVIGLTATPCTKGLGNIYSHLINAATMHELTEQGILVPIVIQQCVVPDMTGAKTSDGEWTAKAASDCELQIVGDVVAEWIKYGKGMKTIAFGPDINYCVELAQRFNEAGIWAATYTTNTPDGERKALLKEFTKPDSKIRILVSVEALAKGFDVQDIGCVIDARPLRKSLSTAIQMWGRGLRSSPSTGKSELILLDHSGNSRRFFDDFVQIYFEGFTSLSTAEKLDSKPRNEELEFDTKGCPMCGKTPFRKRCMSCGYEKPVLSVMSETAGVMREVRIGKNVIAADRHDLWRQLCMYVRSTGNPDTQSGRAYHLFKDITGDPPQRDWRIESTENAPISRGTLSKIKSLRIAFIKGKQAGQKRQEAMA